MSDALWTARDAAHAVDGRLSDGGWSAQGVSIDTRSLKPGDLFVALADQRDGHDFAQAALDKGAAAVMVSRADCARGPRLVVEDVLQGLRALGAGARARCEAVRVGVTGSVGKTGVKEALAAVFRAAGPAHWSEKSYNNHWGVPLTLARMPAQTERAVFEMGMNHAGEIRDLASMVRPHVALITKIAPAHLENLGSMEAIADAKAEIFSRLAGDGVAVIPADDDFAGRLTAAARQSRAAFLIDFGWSPRAAVRVLSYTEDAQGGAGQFDVMGQKLDIRLALPGRHQAVNAAGVVAAAFAAGVGPEMALDALSRLQPVAGRGAWFDAALDDRRLICVIDESYNANPASMTAALSSLGARAPKPGARRIAVLGEMLELGAESAAMHAALAAPVEAAGADLVITVGSGAQALGRALEGRIKTAVAADPGQALQILMENAGDGDVVLIKGSNASGVHKVAASLKQAHSAADTRA
jgi:UDP-N-acetylmuramoyl-tripeptide--D-alanyl-D-alanine ligase